MDISILDEERVMAIIRHDGPFDLKGLFQAVLETGLRTIEITLNTPEAFDLIDTAVRSFGAKMLIGAGTVLSMAELMRALDAGARFIVSPVFNRETVEYCAEKNIPVFPGALTPSEIYEAHQAGAYMAKVFPSSLFGPSYFKSIKAPLPDTRLLAVGGITHMNVNDYLSSGADAVAIGGGIIRKEWVELSDFEAIKNNIIKFLNAIDS